MRPLLFLLPIAFIGCNNEGNTEGSNVPGSLAEIERRIMADPGNAKLFAERARYQEGQDSLVPALNDWRRAIALDSTNATYHIELGNLYYRKVRLAEARSEFEKAVSLDANDTEARLKLSELELVERNYPRAMELANEALRIDQQHAHGYFLKGWIHMEAGDTALAISSFRTAVERDPAFYRAYVQLGVIHAARRDPLAVEYYNSALAARPTSVEAWYGLGMFAQENGRDSIALACYDQIKQISPLDPLPWYNTGYILLEHQRKPSEARIAFKEAIARRPTYADAYYNRGLTYEWDGVLDSAMLDYRRALALAPDMTLATDGLRRLGKRLSGRPN